MNLPRLSADCAKPFLCCAPVFKIRRRTALYRCAWFRQHNAFINRGDHTFCLLIYRDTNQCGGVYTTIAPRWPLPLPAIFYCCGQHYMGPQPTCASRRLLRCRLRLSWHVAYYTDIHQSTESHSLIPRLFITLLFAL